MTSKEDYIVEVYKIENTDPIFSIFKYVIHRKQTRWVRAYHCIESEIPRLFDRIKICYAGGLLTEYGIVLKLEHTDPNIIKCYVKPFQPIRFK